MHRLSEKGRARIYDLWDGFLDKRKVRGLVPCCGQDGHGAQIPQINTYIHNCYWRKLSIYLHNQASSPLKKTFNVVVKKISLSLCKSKNIQGYLAGCVSTLQLILHSDVARSVFVCNDVGDSRKKMETIGHIGL